MSRLVYHFPLLLGMLACTVADKPPARAAYQDLSQSATQRAADLVARMTLEEKVLQMQSSAPAIERLGVAEYNWWNEALHGVAQGRATVFPQAIGLAATWDPDLVRQAADVISTEARAKYHDALARGLASVPADGSTLPGRTAGLTYWSPNVNLFRDPRWGRGQETYGEDPYLAGRLGVAYVRGLQGNHSHYLKVVATPKHFAVHSGPEPERHRFNARVSAEDLAESYLPAFRAAVVEGGAESVMCVYNAVNGTPGCASSDLLQARLREEWGFQGFVVSDCGAVGDIQQPHRFASDLEGAAVAAVRAGTDLTCGSEYRTLVGAVRSRRLPEAVLDRSLVRLFTARFRLGMFDPPEVVPYAQIPLAKNDSDEHRQLAREAASKAIVLLKNDGVLPLDPAVGSLAVVGPAADDPVALLGNYHGISSRQVTTLEGIRDQFGNTRVRYALGATYTAETPALVSGTVLTLPGGDGSGVLAEYFDNSELRGLPKLRRSESRPYFESAMEDPEVTASVGNERYSIRWTAAFTPTMSGEYGLTVALGRWNRTAKAALFLDDQPLGVASEPSVRRTATQAVPTPRSGLSPSRVNLQRGRTYTLRVEYQQPGQGGTLQLRWTPPAQAALDQALALVQGADVAIVCVGLNAELEGEEMGVSIPGFRGGDRTSLDLPEPQARLVEAVIATGKPVVVVLSSGSAIAARHAAAESSALLQAWYGGEEAGTAIAQTLAGKNNPSGRLPVTFYRSVDQLPPFEDYAMQGRTYRFFQGQPLYPFGFGLSYSRFEYSGLRAVRTPQGAEVKALVQNTSERNGDEVAQLYVSSAEGARRTLLGFQRVALRAGERRELRFLLDAEALPQSSLGITVGGGQPAADVPHVAGWLAPTDGSSP